MLDRTSSALAGLSLRHSKAIAILAFAVAALSVAGALRLTFEPLPGEPDEHVVVVSDPRFIEPIAQGYRNSARVDRVEVRGTRVIVKPKRPARDVVFARALLAEGSIIEARALKELRRPLPTITHHGGYDAAVGAADRFRQEVIVTTLLAFAGIVALFAFAFRRVAYAALPILLGLAMTFGFAGAVYGSLSAPSGFPAILTAIGGAWIILFYARYAVERSLLIAMRAAIPPIVLSAIVTAAAALLIDPPSAFGVLFFLLSVAFFLPALIVLGER